MIIDPVTVWKMAPIIMDLVGKYTGKEEAAAVFNSILSLSTLGDVFKDPKIAETPADNAEVPEDPSSFGEGLKIGKGISGIDYEKYNFDNIRGIKAFSKDLKNSDFLPKPCTPGNFEVYFPNSPLPICRPVSLGTSGTSGTSSSS